MKSILTSWALPNKHAAGRIWSVRYSWPALGFRSGSAFTEQENLQQKRQGYNDSELEVENRNVEFGKICSNSSVQVQEVGKAVEGHRI